MNTNVSLLKYVKKNHAFYSVLSGISTVSSQSGDLPPCYSKLSMNQLPPSYSETRDMNEYTQDKSVVLNFLSDVMQHRFQDEAIGEINSAFETNFQINAKSENVESLATYPNSSNQNVQTGPHFYL